MKSKDQSLEKIYWDEFYKTCVIDTPSQFCVSLATDINNKKSIVEFGMGNGRDSLYLATQGYIVVAVDLSSEAVTYCKSSMAMRGVKHVSFFRGDMTEDEVVYNAISNARDKSHDGHDDIVIYSRFVMHALDDSQEEAFLTALSKHMRTADLAYFEFRSDQDSGTEKHFGEASHFRRYVNSDSFVDKLATRYGFCVIYNVTGKGMAKYKEEDPVVTRIIARKV